MSLRARLLAVVAGLTAVGLLAAGLATYAALRSFLVDRVDDSLAASARVLAEPLGRGGPGDRRQLGQLAGLAPGTYVELRDGAGATLWSGSFARRGEEAAVPALPDPLPASGPPPGADFTVDGDGGGGPSFRVHTELTPGGGTLLIAQPLGDVEATLRRLALVELLVALAVLGTVIGLGLWLVRVGLRPLARIEDTAAAIAAGDLSQRVERADDRTEVGRLGRSLNAMLTQIEGAFAERAASEQRLLRFVADASHELRTPLSAIRAYAELFERGARERPGDLERAMRGIERESTRMGTLVDDLLLLARLDQGRPLGREPVNLVALAEAAVDASHALEPERQVTVEAPPSLAVSGDPGRLRQVLDNLLANVRSHTPPGTPATVRLTAGDGHAVVEVADAGPGLAPEDAARVFERFTRLDPSRSRDSGGSGLGLAIVAAIAEAHGGRATIDSTPGVGTCVRVELPLEPAPAERPPGAQAPAAAVLGAES